VKPPLGAVAFASLCDYTVRQQILIAVKCIGPYDMADNDRLQEIDTEADGSPILQQ